MSARAARKLTTDEIALESGTVERTDAPMTVRLASGCYPARRAKSCLVAPEAGDRVLCAVAPDAVFVLAVLGGEEGAATRITADGELKLQAPHGRISLCSAEGVELVSTKEVALSGASIHLRAQSGSVAIEEFGFFGRLVRAEVSKVAIVAQEIDSRLERLVQRAKRVFRFVEEIEQVRAGTVDVRAENLAAIRAENTVVSARVLAKIDGAQVHIG
jgi:hypothetical protein